MPKPRPIFLIGAQKAGSSFLYHLLEQAPEIAGSVVKEPNYYVARQYRQRPFSSFFHASTDERALLDGSTAYLHSNSSTAACIAADQGPAVPIVCVIRDPLERAVSAYLHGVKHGRETRPPTAALRPTGNRFEDIRTSENESIARAIRSGEIVERYRTEGIGDGELDDPLFPWRYVSNSFYADQLKPWIDLFTEVHIVDFETLKRDPKRVFEILAQRLSLSRVTLDLSVKTNPTVVTKPLAIRAFARNLWHQPRPFRKLLALIKGAKRLAIADLDARQIAIHLADAPWVAAARESYNTLREEAVA